MKLPLIACLLLLLLGQGCTPNEVLEPLPLEQFRSYGMAPVKAITLPDGGGTLLLCRRAPTDPYLDFAQFMDANGIPGRRISFAELPRRVENITFLQEDIWITDVLPTANGGAVLVGMGLQRELDERLHLLVYQIDGTGNLLTEPSRRFVCSNAVISVPNDLDRLYNASAMATLLGPEGERVAVAVRYARQGAEERRLYVLPRSGSAPFITTAPSPMNAPGHDLQFINVDPQSPDRIILGYDTSGIGAGSALKMQRIDLGGPVPAVLQEVTLTTRSARITDVAVANGALFFTGHAEEVDQPGVLRPFVARITDLENAEAGLSFLDIANGRSVCPYALDASSDPPRIACSIYEQAVVTDQLRRNDLFADLCVVQLDGTATMGLGNIQVLVPGQGLRPLALGNANGTPVVAGLLHPFLNVDLVHAFHILADTP